MSETKRFIREGDYYGGDVWVENEGDADDEFNEQRINIVWVAFGPYGDISISLSLKEAETLAAELLRRDERA